MAYANGDVFIGGWLDGEKHGAGDALVRRKGQGLRGRMRTEARLGAGRTARRYPNERSGSSGGRFPGTVSGKPAERNAKTKMKPIPGLGLVAPREVETESRQERLRECEAR
jgi:hypothetical protein